MFDPAAHAPTGLTSQGLAPGSLARFAAVLGMALNEADHRPPIVDFINVRRRPERSRFERKHIYMAAGAAAALLLISMIVWRQSTATAREIARIRDEIKTLEPEAKQANELSVKATAVDRWLATDVTWLDGLDRLSERLRPKPLSEKEYPVNEDLVVQQLTIAKPPMSDTAAGRIDIRAVAKNSAAVTALENRTRDTQHQVSTGQGHSDTSTVSGYEWAFNLRVGVMSPSDKEAP